MTDPTAHPPSSPPPVPDLKQVRGCVECGAIICRTCDGIRSRGEIVCECVPSAPATPADREGMGELVARVRAVLDSTMDEAGDETPLHEPSGAMMYAREFYPDRLAYLDVGDVRALCDALAALRSPDAREGQGDAGPSTDFERPLLSDEWFCIAEGANAPTHLTTYPAVAKWWAGCGATVTRVHVRTV